MRASREEPGVLLDIAGVLIQVTRSPETDAHGYRWGNHTAEAKIAKIILLKRFIIIT